MQIDTFLAQLQSTPEQISFEQTMTVIDANYHFTPAVFRNGDVHNSAGQNSGSCKLLAFALLHQLTVPQTLACFGDYYRRDVLQHPESSDHQNIRNFMRSGWQGVAFDSQPLQPRR
jgi:hypothetical protein